jgi:hypothetical protein
MSFQNRAAGGVRRQVAGQARPLGLADVLREIELAIQIAQVNAVVIQEDERTHSLAHQPFTHLGTKTARANEKDFGSLQSGLIEPRQ